MKNLENLTENRRITISKGNTVLFDAELNTPELCLATVQICADVLKDIPKELKTSEICLAAVQKKGNALQYVPAEFKTPDFLQAVAKDSCHE